MDVFHRDIKPENLLIGSDFSLKLADFGWSSNNAALMTTQCGTVAYMAPEVIAGQAYKGAEADLWSAGCG
jgi:serine/threonine protein kinase